MQKYFTGSFLHKMDGKGRLMLPAEYRRVLETLASPHIVVIPGLKRRGVLSAFSQTGYDALIARYEAQPMTEAQREAMAIRLSGAARTVPFDEPGRFVLAQDLRDRAGLIDGVMFVSRVSHFEMWEPAARAVVEAEIAAEADRLLDDFPTGGLH